MVSINGHPATVVGVAPGVFQGGESGLRYDLWVPLSVYRLLDTERSRLDAREFRWLALRGRLAPGATLAEAKAQAAGLVSSWRHTYPGYDNHEADVYGLAASDDGAAGVMRTALIVLAAVAATVLLIACANLANLLLARATARRREMAIRRSLGATRGRLILHTMAEGVLLAAAGAAAAGVALRWTSGLLVMFAPPSELPIGLDATVDGAVIGFTATVALLTVLLFAMFPAIHASGTDMPGTLRDGGTVISGRRARLRRGLVVAQVALSLVLLVASGLCIRSVRAANRIDAGFDIERGLVAWLDPSAAGYDDDRLTPYFDEVARRVAAVPGVEHVSFARRVPLGFQGMSSTAVLVEGYQPAPDERIVLGYNVVGAGYCATMGIPLLAGRDLQASDTADAPRALLISQSAARRYFEGTSAVGKRMRVAGEWATVVGVVPDVKQRSLGERPRPFMYLALAQFPSASVAMHVRTPGDPASLAPAVRAAAAGANAGVPIFNVATLSAHVTAATFEQRLAANLLTVFGGLALLLASLGAYGVVSWLVNQRRREIGVRLAMGATRGAVFRLILGNGTALVVAGVVVGLALSAGAAGVLRSLLVGISPFDPATYLTVVGTLVVIGIAACAVPARRAAAVDPARILREE
jgi:predicted permease